MRRLVTLATAIVVRVANERMHRAVMVGQLEIDFPKRGVERLLGLGEGFEIAIVPIIYRHRAYPSVRKRRRVRCHDGVRAIPLALRIFCMRCARVNARSLQGWARPAFAEPIDGCSSLATAALLMELVSPGLSDLRGVNASC